MFECEIFLGPMTIQFLFILSALIAKCIFANGQSCDMTTPDNEPITWDDSNGFTYINKDELKDDATLNLAFTLQGKDGTLEVQSTDGTAKKYISVTAADQQLNLATNEQFKQFDEDQSKTSDPDLAMNLIVNFNCNTLKMQLTVLIAVEDTNNHDPTFEESSYIYKLPMPLVPNVDLTNFGKPIIATDIDFSNQNIVFTISDPSSNFILETESSADSKEYRAKLMVPECTSLTDDDTTLTLTATDSGDPPRKATIQIAIHVYRCSNSTSLPDVMKIPKERE